MSSSLVYSPIHSIFVMIYANIPQNIPQEQRAEINRSILASLKTSAKKLPAETVYNSYTGLGGLHGLDREDFDSYNDYARAKKEFEMGQFFTPHEICRDMVDMLSPVSSEMVLDMCCGMGNFFNHLPNPHNAYGFDIDGRPWLSHDTSTWKPILRNATSGNITRNNASILSSVILLST